MKKWMIRMIRFGIGWKKKGQETGVRGQVSREGSELATRIARK
jgi:hypothetical protein